MSNVMPHGPEGPFDLAVETRASLEGRGYKNAPLYICFFIAAWGEEVGVRFSTLEGLANFFQTFQPARVRIDCGKGEDVSELQELVTPFAIWERESHAGATLH